MPLVLEEEERLLLRDCEPRALGALLPDECAVALPGFRVVLGVVDDDFTGEGVTGMTDASLLFGDRCERFGGVFPGGESSTLGV